MNFASIAAMASDVADSVMSFVGDEGVESPRQGTKRKRARTEMPECDDGTAAQKQASKLEPSPPLGRAQLLIVDSGLRDRLGKKYCDENHFLKLLLSHGVVRRVHTIEVEVRPLGGDSFKMRLDATAARVAEAKSEITRVHGTLEQQQDLYRVVVRAGGNDVAPELLNDESILEDRDVVAVAVKERPLLWRTCGDQFVTLSEGGVVATYTDNDRRSGEMVLVTSGEQLVSGNHYWEVELLASQPRVYVGVSRPNLEAHGEYLESDCTNGWFIKASGGSLHGNGKSDSDQVQGGSSGDSFKQGDCVGVLLDLDCGSLRFFKNGVQHGLGYPPGSVNGAVVHALQMLESNECARLLPKAQLPKEARS
jgi:hypothetical protein